MDFEGLFRQFQNKKVVVLGDLMLDTYWWGHVERISPEAPVPVVTLDQREYRIGGAGNVALNLASLGTAVTILSVTGKDDDSLVLNELLRKNNIRHSRLLQSEDRITTNKIRIISRNQQMMRLDSETTRDLSAEDENRMIHAIQKCLIEEKPDVLIFEDYNKGVLTEKIISYSIDLCKQMQIVTAVDPKRKNFFSYQGVDIFKPNLKEVKDALNLLVDDSGLSSLQSIHQHLAEKLQHRISFITLSEKGVFFQAGELSEIVGSHVRNISDVSGAGDTVIAVASLVYAATKNAKLMAEIANIAGGLVCEEVGTAAINRERLLGECQALLH